MPIIKNMNTALGSRATWSLDPNPLYPMTFMELFDVGSDHQTALGCLKPGASQHPHYHAAGADIFLILHGTGELHSGHLGADGQLNGALTVQNVTVGDLYSIAPFEVHSLVNTGSADLVWLNVAPTSHGDTDLIEVDAPIVKNGAFPSY